MIASLRERLMLFKLQALRWTEQAKARFKQHLPVWTEKVKALLKQQAVQLADQSKTLITYKPPELPPPLEEPSLWDDDTPLMDLTGCGDYLTLKSMYTGVQVYGSTGSGKSSSMAELARILMELDCGFVWMALKTSELALVKKIAFYAGRLDDVCVFGEDTDGSISPYTFNPLEYEASKSSSTTTLVQYLSMCSEVLSRKEGQKASHGSGGSDRFWQSQFERLLRYCIDTAKLAGRPLSVDLLRQIQLSAPKTRQELIDPELGSKSECWKCLREAEDRKDAGEIPSEDFDRVFAFWTNDYFSLDSKPRGVIDVTFAALVDCFYAEEPLRSLLTKGTNLTPDDVINDGKIVVLSLPVSKYHEAGRMAQFCFSYSYKRRMLAREKPVDGSALRPCVWWCDEAHSFANCNDSSYFNEIRSNRGINVLLEQSVGGYMNALGADRREQVAHFLGGLATKVYFQNDCPETNLLASDTIGKRLLQQAGDNWGHSQDGVHIGGNQHEVERHQLVSGEFQRLRRGGVENDLIVEGYVTMAGKIFNATGTNYALCRFMQSDLTKG